MPIPTEYDRKLGEIDDLAGVVMIRLRTLQHAGSRRDGESVRAALDQYAAAVRALALDAGE
jgi:hypothetical protein